jgi:hypothetical protein
MNETAEMDGISSTSSLHGPLYQAVQQRQPVLRIFRTTVNTDTAADASHSASNISEQNMYSGIGLTSRRIPYQSSTWIPNQPLLGRHQNIQAISHPRVGNSYLDRH